jgi:hypothetical protein
MDTARTHVFVFVPILSERVAQTRAPIAFRSGSNGSSPPEQKQAERPWWQVRHSDGWETQALPNHLFWTWFVDNPRLVSKSR